MHHEFKSHNRLARKAGRNEPQNGYVYVINCNSHGYKIGRTVDIITRSKTFARYPFNGVLVLSLPVSDFINIEKQIHAMYSHKHIEHEFFSLDDSDLVVIQNFLSQHKIREATV